MTPYHYQIVIIFIAFKAQGSSVFCYTLILSFYPSLHHFFYHFLMGKWACSSYSSLVPPWLTVTWVLMSHWEIIAPWGHQCLLCVSSVKPRSGLTEPEAIFAVRDSQTFKSNDLWVHWLQMKLWAELQINHTFWLFTNYTYKMCVKQPGERLPATPVILSYWSHSYAAAAQDEMPAAKQNSFENVILDPKGTVLPN